jgi:hypothetical protein
MKRSVWSGILFFCWIQVNATIVRWDGEANDGLWSNALNWDLDRIPDVDDDVVLDNSIVLSSYNVTLPSGNTPVILISLKITPGALFSIHCNIPSFNTAQPALLLTASGDALILDRGAVLRNASGALAGTPLSVTANGLFRINNGGHYIHQTSRGHTDFLVSRLSSSPGTEDGIFEFDVPGTASYTVSVSGRTFGKLIFSSSNAGVGRTYTGAGINRVYIRGGLTIKENTVLSYGANTDTVTIEGLCSIAPGATFNIANGSNKAVIRLKGDLDNRGSITETGSSSGSGIFMNGAEVQMISGGGSVLQEVKLTVENPAGIILSSPLHLPYQLEFITGKIITSAANLLSLGVNTVCNGAGVTGFVEGPVKKAGRSAFTFPVGVGEIYAPVSFEEGGADTDEFIVSYRRTNPQSIPGLGSNCISPINHVSYVEFWELDQAMGNSSRKIQFPVLPFSFVRNLEAIVVSRFENGSWKSEGGVDHLVGLPSPPYATGTVSTAAAVNSFGAFTLGSVIDQQLNPLPVHIEKFDAQTVNGQVRLSWTAGDCNTPGWKFLLQHGVKENSFNDLVTIEATANNCDYGFVHSFPPAGQQYYRMYVLNSAGDTVYRTSLSAHIIGHAREVDHYVRVVRKIADGIELATDLPAGRAEVFIIDQIGSLVTRRILYVERPGSLLLIKMPFLSRGMYRLVAVSGNIKVSTVFVH